MTASLPPRPQGWTEGAVGGCTERGCGTQETVTVSRLGGRCAAHPPTFDPATAVGLMVAGWPATAMAYIRAGLEVA